MDAELDLAKEECRDQRPLQWLDHFRRDLRYAGRCLRNSPGFTAAAVLTLALAIGANTAIFSALEGVVLEPLPYRDPDRLVLMARYNRTSKSTMMPTYPDFLDWQQNSRSFVQIAGFNQQGFDLSSPGTPEHVQGKQISSNFFRALGVNLTLGRELSPEEDTASGPPAVVVPRWGAARNVAAQVVGVVGHVEHYGLDGSLGEKPQIYYSFYQLPDDAVATFGQEAALAIRTPLNVATVIPAVQRVVHEAGADQPVYNIQMMQDLVSQSMGRQQFPTVLLMAFASLALVLACVGTYGVISYSTNQRMREIGIRIALGADRPQVLRTIIWQGIWLALVGVAVGTSAALMLAKALPSFSHLLYGIEATDPMTFFGTSVLLISTAVVACYIPARRAARFNPMIALRSD